MATPKLVIEAPETITLVRGVPFRPKVTAIGTNGRVVPNARITLDTVNEIVVEGDTLIASPAGASASKLIATWHRSDGQTPTAERPLQIVLEVPNPEAPPDDPAPAPDDPSTPIPDDPNAILVAQFTYAVSGLKVDVDRTISKRPDGGGRTFWDFGDGSGERQGLARDSHTYQQPGTYSVTLRLDANAHPGLESSVTHDMTVADDGTVPPPPPQPTPGPTPPPPPIPSPGDDTIPTNLPVLLVRAMDGGRLEGTSAAYRPDSAWTKNDAGKVGPIDATRFNSDAVYRKNVFRANGWDEVEVTRNGRVVDTPHGPMMEHRWPEGSRSGVGAGLEQTTPALPACSKVLLEFDFMLSPNFFGNTAGTNKMLFKGLVAGGNQLFLSAHGVGLGPLSLKFMLQGVRHHAIGMIPVKPGLSECGNIYDSDRQALSGRTSLAVMNGEPLGSLDGICWDVLGDATLARGQIHRISWLTEMNSAPGRADATVRLWKDGKQTLRVRGLDLTHKSTGGVLIRGFHGNSIWGGGGPNVPDQDPATTDDIWMRFRNVVWSGA